jgi:adenylate cyclase
MRNLTREDIAARAGVDAGDVDDFVRLGILKPAPEDGTFTPGAVPIVRVIRDLEGSGVSRESLGEAARDGSLDFGIFEMSTYDRFASLSDQTFREAAERTGIPVELALLAREAIGFAIAEPDDRMREDELEVLPMIQTALAGGLPPSAIERLLRVYGESLRRAAETETEAWTTHLIRPAIDAGQPVQQVYEMGSRFGEAALPLLDQALLAIHRGQQGHVWMTAIYELVEQVLEASGLGDRVTRPPAMCFLDLSGYTRLTEEQGDQAAAQTALTFSRLVQRTAHERRGRVVKWLGDGVMLHFGEPADAVVGALEMAERVPAAGLPQAHVGVDAGPVIVQDGDYFGSTVNVAARIAAYARAGEVLASDRALAATDHLPGWILATDIGPVDLKGVSKPIALRKVERQADAGVRSHPAAGA